MKLALTDKPAGLIYGEDERLVTPGFLVGIVLILILLWVFDYFILRNPILTPLMANGKYLKAMTPVYAFWKPIMRLDAIIFLVATLFFVTFSTAAQKVKTYSPFCFSIYIFVAYAILAVALLLVRNNLSELASNLLIYPTEEVYYDAQRIVTITDFIRHYKTLQPELSMRGQHYPPGGAIFLFVVSKILGEGLWKIGAVLVVVASTSVTLCYFAMRHILPEFHARQAVLLLATSPSLLDFTCTSMDILFFLFSSLCLLSTAMVQSRQAGVVSYHGFRYSALFTGIFLYLASIVSFSSFPLYMCLFLFMIINGKAMIKQTTINICTISVGYIITYFLIYFIFGYSLLENLSYARQNSLRLLTNVLNGPPSDYYFYACFGNIAAFLIGCGVAVVGAVASSSIDSHFMWTPWRIASLMTLVFITVGGIYVMETERIWIYVIPWMVVFALNNRPFRTSSLRLLLACGLMQALFMEALLFTLW